MPSYTHTSPDMDNNLESLRMLTKLGPQNEAGDLTLAERVETEITFEETISDGTSRKITKTVPNDDTDADLIAEGWVAGDAAEYRRLSKMKYNAAQRKAGLRP